MVLPLSSEIDDVAFISGGGGGGGNGGSGR